MSQWLLPFAPDATPQARKMHGRGGANAAEGAVCRALNVSTCIMHCYALLTATGCMWCEAQSLATLGDCQDDASQGLCQVELQKSADVLP